MKNRPTMPKMDLLKFFFSICIVAIHTNLFCEYPDFHYWFEKAILRLAVPFFMCASGYLFAIKCWNGNQFIIEKSILNQYSRRLLILLLVFEPISIVLRILIMRLNGVDGVGIALRVVRSILFYPWGALWYVQAVLVGIWVAYYVLKRKSLYSSIICGLFLYGCGMLCNSYYWLIEGGKLQVAVDLYLKFCVTARNGLFMGYMYVLIGILCAKIKLKRPAFFTLVFYILYVLELHLLHDYHMKDDGTLFLFLPVVAFGLVQVAANNLSSVLRTVILRNLSTGIYLLHRPLTYFFQILALCGLVNLSNEARFLLITIFLMIFCLLAYKMDWKLARLIK